MTAANRLTVQVVARRSWLYWPRFAIAVVGVLCGMNPDRAARTLAKGVTVKAVLR